MSQEHTNAKKCYNISSMLKFRLFIAFCVLIHAIIAIFAFWTDIYPMFYFNVGSVSVYILCTFLLKRHELLVFLIGFAEIILHSFVSVILIGNNFGFSMYFVAMIPMSYHLLHATKTNRYIIKASIMSTISFVLFCTCYIISNTNDPVYHSNTLNTVRPYVYVVNMFITFIALTGFSILFLIEIENAYAHLYNKNLELGNLANTDPLTGLYNRRTMTDHVKNMYEDYLETKEPFTLIICDIDNFKQFNDTYGHECGDMVLKSISTLLSDAIRDQDFLCRWGGEEFLVFLKNIDVQQGKTIAERIRVQITENDVQYNDNKLRITMTFGVAASTEADSYNELFKLADARLYEGKKSGKNKVV